MSRPPRWQPTLDASVEEECLAVRLCSDSSESGAFEGFVVQMHLAWLHLLHAVLIRGDIDYRCWDKNYNRRLLRVDGEPKRCELERSTNKRWPGPTNPVHVNPAMFMPPSPILKTCAWGL